MFKCAGDMQDKTIINRIMLRFRPIAPKPVTGDSASGESLGGYKNSIVSSRRKKRKYVRVSKNCRNSGKKISKRVSDQGTGDGPTNKETILPLMPEKADLDGTAGVSSVPGDLEQPMNLSLKTNIPVTDEVAGTRVADRTVVESWVTVESVTDTCMDDGALGRTDVEKMKNLERDTCPGFISDGSNRVVWVNEAYKRMVTGTQQDGGGQPPDAVVSLVMKERLLPYTQYLYRAFSCHVGVQYTWRKDKYTKMVPCDVWRMDSGGYAWRLDVKAALSLGI
ncbi:hypothetical protein SLEP1_g48888 [Rubroshorea leprosula]|uniref:DUF7950 domain-containing protein n=1 Tax=Rubroshorea leprosula TaxID=152421 RepID=A0AAV5LV31_9ROSI|nr:hypothetical protein SLEP1_g48888 [Rubroshorea leprosula]